MCSFPLIGRAFKTMTILFIHLIIIYLLFGIMWLVNCDDNRIKYEPNWNSLDQRPLPTWYDEAKIGIFIHWGVYTVPSIGSEWFWHNWKNLKVDKYVRYMKNNYKPDYTYQNFAQEFTAELFNATQWAHLFKDAGARYVVLVSKHHDGFCLWPSPYSFSWNSMDVGPKRDILKELSLAIRQNTNLKFGVYYSLFEWFNRLYIKDKQRLFLTQNYVDSKMRPEQINLVQEYKPDIIWSDGDWDASDSYWKSTEFLAWLYNNSPVRDSVVVNDRWGNGTSCHHGGFYNCKDRFNPHHLLEHKWENCISVDKSSWGQRFDVTLEDFLTPEELIAELVTTISCNGNFLVNISPTKYGTITPIFEERLRQMGYWLNINGDAIYNTKPWLVQNDISTPDVWYTSRQISSNKIYIYAILIKYPFETNTISVQPWSSLFNNSNVILIGLDEQHLTDQQLNDTIKEIKLLGMPTGTIIKWEYLPEAKMLSVQFPPKYHLDEAGLKYAWTLQIDMEI